MSGTSLDGLDIVYAEITNEEHKCPCPYHLNLKNETAKAVNKLIVNLKRDYIRNELDKHKHDAKKLWRAIRELWPGNKRKNTKTMNFIQTTFSR